MRCLNCGSLNADELNISLNASETVRGVAEPEFVGETEYGDCLSGIGTTCPDCGELTYSSDAPMVVLQDLFTRQEIAHALLPLHVIAAEERQ